MPNPEKYEESVIWPSAQLERSSVRSCPTTYEKPSLKNATPPETGMSLLQSEERNRTGCSTGAENV